MEQLSLEDQLREAFGESARPKRGTGFTTFAQTMPYPCATDGCPNTIEFYLTDASGARPPFCNECGGPKEPSRGDTH